MSTTTDDSLLPFSPFSDASSVSDPTSDELPDLGQFTFVFRTLSHLQPNPWMIPRPPSLPDTQSTVWHQLPILSYLDLAEHSPPDASSSPSDGARTVEISSNDGLSSPDSHSQDDGGSPFRLPLRPYSPAWDSDDNHVEFGPFDGATTASSATRPTDDDPGTPSSVQAGTASTSAHDDSSSSERPASLPPTYFFSSPFNDNSTRSSSPPFHNSLLYHSHTVLPHHQHRRSGSTSTITSVPATTITTTTTTTTTTRATHLLNDRTPDLASLAILSRTSPAHPTDSDVPSDTHSDPSSDIPSSASHSLVSLDSVQLALSSFHVDHHSLMDVRSYSDALSQDGVDVLDEPLPSLGLLDEALKFIAEERAKWEALRDTGIVSGTLSSDSERWMHELGSDSARESNNATSTASDLMLLSPKSQPRKKKRLNKPMTSSANPSPAKKTIDVSKLSGSATPIMSILRPDGTIIGRSADASRKRQSLGSDGYSGSGTLTPRMGAIDGGGVELTPTKARTKKKGKDKGLSHSRSVPELKISTTEEGPHLQVEMLDSGTATVHVKDKHANVNMANAQTHAVNTKRAQLLILARQLQEVFPNDKRHLEHVFRSLDKQKLWKPHNKPTEKQKQVAVESTSSGDERIVFEDDEDLDPRGRPPRKGDPLIHVFIDHSNILFGLLAHLKRHPPRRPLPPTPVPHTGRGSSTQHTSSAPASPAATQLERGVPSASTILPLPSFATVRRARRPSESGSGHEASSLMLSPTAAADEGRARRRVRHLSHAALSLILERGRPVTRRVLVTSSPLYQPMDGMERLGYQVRVFRRVPDLGDGMDRDHRRERQREAALARSYTHHSGSFKSSGRLSLSAGSGSGSSSGSTSTWASGAISKSPNKKPQTRPRPLSSSALLSPPNDPIASTSTSTGTGTGTTGSAGAQRIRFREQGVDELLQLKLHQALAAEDVVREGATIVLATGDGNVGQFNEEGFLGPVRTALKRGWKVELYSWQGGLSRAWKREFGEDSEWGKSGMFRVIGMEQFASSLVEDGWVEV
ncbi:hypothetical protein APHAL10511_005207 [Amanita phalloides]|nr:hypothetical protein APHAL10511_005207 [Amanita phalloides]